MNDKNIRVIIVLGVLIIHLLIATKIRFIAYQNNWGIIIQIVLGSIPSFYSVIGLTSLANIFEKTKRLKMIFIVGFACLLYEITGDFGRTSGSGTNFDVYDIAAILIGILISYLLEKYYFIKIESKTNHNTI